MINATTPVWANEEHTAINLLADFPWLGGMTEFTARPDDCVAYGVDLYNRAMAGEFGAIAPYVEPAAVTAIKQKQQMKEAAKSDLEGDVVLTYLKNHTPAEINAYIQSNVNNLASAKDVIAKLAAAVSVLLR